MMIDVISYKMCAEIFVRLLTLFLPSIDKVDRVTAVSQRDHSRGGKHYTGNTRSVLARGPGSGARGAHRST